MELGQKLKQARLEAGLSQRQLCGDEITRNMLSQIENGSARPSMDTLRFLARQLGKPVSYFLEEQAVVLPNQATMAQARAAYAAKEYDRALALLENCRLPDEDFGWEMALLKALCLMGLAEQALDRGRLPYGVQLLEQAAAAGKGTPYFDEGMERRWLLLLAQARQTVNLPADDRELLYRAYRALEQNDPDRALQYLDAAEDRTAPAWNYLRGRTLAAQGLHAEAVACLQKAEPVYPRPCAVLLEQSCLAMEDYKGAYYYSKKHRDLTEG